MYKRQALHSADYRHQVVGALDPQIGADRAFSLREQFPDQWYELVNPADPAAPLTVRFATAREDFPPNIDGDPAMTHLMVGLMPADGATPNATVTSLRLRQKQGTVEVGTAPTRNGFINTRDPGVSWRWNGTVPIGEWEMTLDGGARSLFTDGKIEDILFVVTYEGRTPAWTS